ncbi:DUF305 domain-containing protein [Deinococcus hohokamensis]|uniref:DUF305 domain-containing protein n=1 Tax=Deinococcus hohokamensis TaxID=309883 RepID=A0ABV9I985_9DEIO
MNRLLLLAVLTLLTLTPATAQTGHSGMSHGAAVSPAPAASRQPLARLSGRAFDRAFLSMMTVHHRAALDMSRAALARSRSAQVRAWASSIIKSQSAEIGQMQRLLSAVGGTDAAMAAEMKGMMAGMAGSVKSAANPDRAFLEGMLPHHASAVEMASLALQKSASPAVLGLARDIVRAQAQEMYEFRRALLK